MLIVYIYIPYFLLCSVDLWHLLSTSEPYSSLLCLFGADPGMSALHDSWVQPVTWYIRVRVHSMLPELTSNFILSSFVLSCIQMYTCSFFWISKSIFRLRVVCKLFLHCDTRFWDGLWYYCYANFCYYYICMFRLWSRSLALRLWCCFLISYHFGCLTYLSRLRCDKCYHNP